MMTARTVAICAFGIVCSTRGLSAQGLSQYRDFVLGSDLAAVSTLTGLAASDVKTIHQRPAVLQDLEWRPSRWNTDSTSATTDPVEQIHFSFYNNQLFRVVVDYAHERTEGMTDADMIEAITAAYGSPVTRVSRPAARAVWQIEAESGLAVSRWGDATHTVVLYRTVSYGAPFRLILSETRLDDLARKADMQARRLDDLEAPRREIARQKKDVEDSRAAGAKARVINKKGFRP